MTHSVLDAPISPLRQRVIDDMNMRRFSRETQRNYLRDIGRLATSGVHQTRRPPRTCAGSRSSSRRMAFPFRQ
jgi:hypothetical protein